MGRQVDRIAARWRGAAVHHRGCGAAPQTRLIFAFADWAERNETQRNTGVGPPRRSRVSPTYRCRAGVAQRIPPNEIHDRRVAPALPDPVVAEVGWAERSKVQRNTGVGLPR